MCVNATLPSEKYDHLIICQVFRRAVKFRICNMENVINFPYIPQSVIIVVIHVSFFVIVCEMQVT